MSARRLRAAEWLAALGAIVLIVDLFALRWYAVPARGGWQAIPTLRWALLVTAALGLALALAQAAVRGPALPVTLDLIGWLVASVTTILLVIRLATTGASLRFGAVLGLLATGAVARGAFVALRSEQGWVVTAEEPVELVTVPGGEDGR